MQNVSFSRYLHAPFIVVTRLVPQGRWSETSQSWCVRINSFFVFYFFIFKKIVFFFNCFFFIFQVCLYRWELVLGWANRGREVEDISVTARWLVSVGWAGVGVEEILVRSSGRWSALASLSCGIAGRLFKFQPPSILIKRFRTCRRGPPWSPTRLLLWARPNLIAQ